MSAKTIRIKTFNPTADSFGLNGPDFVGNIRKGELRGIIKINQDLCEACDTCRKVCPVDAIQGHLGAKHKIDDQRCVTCGQCLISCPFNAIEQMSFVDTVDKMLADKSNVVVAHPSPAVRVSIAEEFGGKPGDLTTDQMMNAFEKLGFKTYDVNSSADQTIMEEGTEFVRKVQYWVLGKRGPEFERAAHHPLPHFTSCCPAWVRNAETFNADFLPHLSTAKSPIQMGGVLAKVWAPKFLYNTDPRNVKVVAITPCTAKILEASRPEMDTAWRHHIKAGTIPADTPRFPDVDAVLTARDIAELLRRHNINPLTLPKERKRENLDVYTGAGTIFGCSGGVMEAALRTAYEVITGKTLEDVNFTAVRGMDGIKEASVKIGDLDVNVAVASSTGKASELLEMVKKGEKNYTFIEIMGCPGGCVNGGGQPIVSSQIRNWTDIRPLRAKALYDEDASKKLRKSHENPEIKQIYEEYLGKPNGHKSHELLHTTYEKRELYQ